jgi:hypothetical protein
MVTFTYSVDEFIKLIEVFIEQGEQPLIAIKRAVYELGRDYGVKVDRVSVTGLPLYSMTASGRYRDKVFVTRAGQATHVRPYLIPHDPKTAKQLAHRQKLKSAVAEWQKMTPEQREEWNILAINEPMSGYNLFIQTAMKRK